MIKRFLNVNFIKENRVNSKGCGLIKDVVIYSIVFFFSGNYLFFIKEFRRVLNFNRECGVGFCIMCMLDFYIW